MEETPIDVSIKKGSTPDNAYTDISLFCAIITIFGALAYRLLRQGYADNSFYPSLQFMGISFFLLFLPHNLISWLRQLNTPFRESWLSARAILSIYGLVLLCIAGILSAFITLKYVFIIPGYLFFLVALFNFLRRKRFIKIILGLSLTLFFSIWVVAITLRPTMLEHAVAGIPHIDFWFHSSMAQMLKTYGVPSTGLDGVPWMYYHYGSHWIMAQLSQLLDLPVTALYSLGYTVIFVPLFIQTYLFFALSIQEHIVKVNRPTLNFLFWLLFLCFFIQVIKNLYSGLFLGYNFLGGESYVISLTFMFALFNGGILFWKKTATNEWKHNIGFVLIMFPLSLIALGFLKVSTMFIVFGIAGYLFLRLQLFRRWLYWWGLFVSLFAFVFVYLQVTETLTLGGRTLGYEGGFHPLYFYTDTHPFEPLNFFVFYFQWTYLFILLILIKENVFNLQVLWEAFVKRRIIAVECLVVVAVLGVLPGLFLLLTGGNAMYFSSVQALLASSLLLAYLPSFRFKQSYLKRLPDWSKHALYFVLIISIFLVLYMHTRFAVNDAIRSNVDTRKIILKDTSSLSMDLTSVLQLGWTSITGSTYSKEQQQMLHWFSPSVQKALDCDSSYIFLKKVVNLERKPLPEKKQAIIYTDFIRHPLPFKLPCHIVPFLVPSLSGITALEGHPYDCPAGAYGYEYYNGRYKFYPGWDHVYRPDELCQQAKGKGFEKVLYFDYSRYGFIKLPCP